MDNYVLGYATGVATQNSINEGTAKTQFCKLLEKNFNANSATIEDKKEYAKCIGRIYPDPISPETILYLKIAFVLFFLTFIITSFKSKESPFLDRIIVAFIYGLVVLWAYLTLLGFCYGLIWVFS